MRLPNGFGTVYKLSGNRRRPYIARKTVGWDDSGKQLYKTIGYFKTKQEGLKALADYNDNPYDLNASTVTFAELYEKWFDRRKDKLSRSNLNAYKMAFNLSKELHDLVFVNIRTEHLQNVIDKCNKGHSTLRKIKVLFNQLYDYAMEKDIVSKKYSDYIEMPSNDEESTRKPFTTEEIQTLWDHIDDITDVDTVLIMIYTGLRPGELVLIESKNIHLNKRYMSGGLKTPAGKNRIIPINKKIHPLIEKRISGGSKYLIASEAGEKISYYTYYDYHFKPVMELLHMDHKPHDCRHTFATLMDNAGANKLSIKRIMGHASKDVTDKVYTHKDIEELIKAIDMI